MKKPRVTRTMLGTDAVFVIVDRNNSVMENKRMIIPRVFKNDAQLIKIAQSKLSKTNENLLVLRVVEKTNKKYFCQMLEDEYFDRAEKTEI